MPILANTVIATLEDDADRYADMLVNARVYSVVKFDGNAYDLYAGLSDTEIDGLEDCTLMLLTDADNAVVYSCYYKVASAPKFGIRVVQVEVRCSVPGLARHMMQRMVNNGHVIRTDISNTPAGRKMWERFIQQNDFEYFIADLSIDLRKPYGHTNQDANQNEIYENLRKLEAGEEIWHPNRKSGYVSVVYATKVSPL